MSIETEEAFSTLALANRITKALYPDLYGKAGLSVDQGCLLLGARGIIEEVLRRHISPNILEEAAIGRFVAKAFNESKTSTSERLLDDLGLCVQEAHQPLSWHIARHLERQRKENGNG